MRKERTRGDLAVEAGGPASGNQARTTGAATFGSEAVFFDVVSVSSDQSLTALRAACIFPMTDHAGKITGVDVAQSRRPANFGGLQKIFDGGVALVSSLHFVVAVEGGHVPRDVGGDAREKFGEAPQFVGGIVEAGDEQGDDLQPQSHLVNAADAVEDRGDPSAEFVVVTIVKTLEVYFVEIEMGTDKVENLRRGVAVGDESSEQSRGFRFPENGDGPLAGDEWLVVGADQNLRALIESVAHQDFRRSFQRRRYGIGIAQRLRRDPILTIATVQIAAQHSEAVGERARMGVEERFLFDGIALHPGGVSPGNIKRAAAVVAHFADAGLALGNGATVTARETAHTAVVEFLVESWIGLANSAVKDVAEGGHGKPLSVF